MHTIFARPSVSHDVNTMTAFDWAATAVDGLERVVGLNLQTIKTSLSEQQALTGAAFDSRSVDELVDLQFQQFPAVLKKTFAYWRHLEEIAVETGNEFAGVLRESLQRSLSTVPAVTVRAASTASDAAHALPLIGVVAPTESSGAPVAILDGDGNVVSSGG